MLAVGRRVDCKVVFLSVKLDLDCWKLRRRIHRNCLNEVTKKNIYYTFDLEVRDRNCIVLSLIFSLTNKSTHIFSRPEYKSCDFASKPSWALQLIEGNKVHHQSEGITGVRDPLSLIAGNLLSNCFWTKPSTIAGKCSDFWQSGNNHKVRFRIPKTSNWRHHLQAGGNRG